MSILKSSSLIPALQAQMQWFSGQPQLAGGNLSRVLYDFNNPENILERKVDEFSELVEIDDNHQECAICDPETGRMALYYNGENVYDGFHNKLNEIPVNAMKSSYLTSIIAPNLSRDRTSYNLFYIDDLSHHIEYVIVDFPDGQDSPGKYIGKKTIESKAMPSPLGLACINESEYWLLALHNAHTLIAYRFDNTGTVYPAINVSLAPLLYMDNISIDCESSSIISFGEKIAITVNGALMVGEMIFSGLSGFSITRQELVDGSVSSLAPAFNKDKRKLYFLKNTSNNLDHVYVYEIDPGASYSIDSSYEYINEYRTLKLAPNGNIYGTDIFPSTQVDPLLMIEEISSTGTAVISEILTDAMYSSVTFGNVQYEINSLRKGRARYS
ncbi:hypothetical protein MRBLME3_001639 [Enterobacter ludwigii]|uniref:hypothetical protein n=1 Tax=Enterobacter ludwigii TaxID=299767 RepID=UPI0034179BFA